MCRAWPRFHFDCNHKTFSQHLRFARDWVCHAYLFSESKRISTATKIGLKAMHVDRLFVFRAWFQPNHNCEKVSIYSPEKPIKVAGLLRSMAKPDLNSFWIDNHHVDI